MLHMIDVTYAKTRRDEALAYFQEHGMTHYNGDLVIKGLWVCTNQCLAYVLVEASDPIEVDRACEKLRQFGEVDHRAVISSDEI